MNFEENSIYWGGIRWHNLTSARLEDPKCLERYGFKSYSQNDEDGIIEEIFNRIGTTNKTFVEFGVEDGLESNAHLLLFKGWNGLWIEGSEKCYNNLCAKFNPVIEKGFLKVINAFITKDNINELITQGTIQGEIDLLSVDVDGNDYYIWESINVVNPRVVIIEYNGKFPPSVEWIMAYDENHVWDGTDWHGASLKSLELLGRKKGYQLVATGITGANAFFVREDLAGDKFILPANSETLYNPARMGITHKIGLPNGVCLYQQNVNMGKFDYCPNRVIIPHYGFESEEIWSDGRSIHWISNTQSCLLVNTEFIQQKSKLLIGYANFPLKHKQVKVNIDFDGKRVINEFKTEQEGILEIVFEQKDYLEKVIPINIEISQLWRGSEEFGSNDTRELGIALFIEDAIVQ